METTTLQVAASWGTTRRRDAEASLEAGRAMSSQISGAGALPARTTRRCFWALIPPQSVALWRIPGNTVERTKEQSAVRPDLA